MLGKHVSCKKNEQGLLQDVTHQDGGVSGRSREVT